MPKLKQKAQQKGLKFQQKENNGTGWKKAWNDKRTNSQIRKQGHNCNVKARWKNCKSYMPYSLRG